MIQGKRRFLLVAALITCFSCGGKQEQIDRKFVDGVEIVVNHLEPYKVEAKGSLALEEIFKIDTEREDMAKLGIFNIRVFEVDSGGEIFCLAEARETGHFIYHFDQDGNFIKSFGSKGQGPGEVQQPRYLYLDSLENIVIVDLGSRYPLSIFDKNGSFLYGQGTTRNALEITSGPGTEYLVKEAELVNDEYRFILKALNSDSTESAVLDKYGVKADREKIRVIEPVFCWSASGRKVFVANEERAYDIRVFDINGKLIRRIQKPYEKVALSENDKQEALKQFPVSPGPAAYFPDFRPPIRGIFAGEDGTLFVSTFEKGDVPGEFIFDIFNPAGVFVARKSLGALVWENHLWAKTVGDKLYCLREKASGFREIVAYLMKWE